LFRVKNQILENRNNDRSMLWTRKIGELPVELFDYILEFVKMYHVRKKLRLFLVHLQTSKYPNDICYKNENRIRVQIIVWTFDGLFKQQLVFVNDSGTVLQFSSYREPYDGNIVMLKKRWHCLH
jgi:hypothetical protein